MAKETPAQNTMPDINQNNNVISIIASKEFLSAQECDQIIALADKETPLQGAVDESNKLIIETRQSSVVFLPQNDETDWLYQKMSVAVSHINAEAYGYDIAGFELAQVATYDEGGQYDWHMDLGPGDHSTRKLSLTVQLSDPDNYDGGGLEFMEVDTPTTRDQGSIIFFPSFFHHRVLPVTKGCRKSLVAWVNGNAFR